MFSKQTKSHMKEVTHTNGNYSKWTRDCMGNFFRYTRLGTNVRMQ